MKNAIKISTFVLALIVFCNKASASPPIYVGDPDCLVGGTIRNVELKKGNRGQQYQECLNPITTLTDCDWILDAGEDKYLTTINVSDSINKQSAKDSLVCSSLYASGKEHVFSVSVNLFKQFQLKNGDSISGNVMRGGEFSSLQKKDLALSASQKLYYFILKNIFWFIILIPVTILIVFVIIRKLKNSPK